MATPDAGDSTTSTERNMGSMKKSTIGLILLFFFAAATAFAEPVSLQTAGTVAQNWIGDRTLTKSTAFAPTEVFAGYENGKIAYYVVNLSPEGWVIVSADDVARPVIAYSPKGSYRPENHPPAFDEWMNAVKKAIIKAAGGTLPADDEIADEWQRLTENPDDFGKLPRAETRSVGQLVQTTWGQNPPYNLQCPVDASGPENHAVTGCVATAMAQIMKYHAYPQTGYGTHSYVPELHPEYGTLLADFGAALYDFAKMPNTTEEYDTQDKIDEIAGLSFHCGVSVEMNYGPTASSANMETAARNALKNYFKYEESLYAVRKSDHTDEDWEALLKVELDAQRPMLYAGPGHSFICDGYDDSDFFHFNWGWEGYLDGSFLLSSLTPTGYNFTTGQSAVIHIRQPMEPQLAYPYVQDFENGLPEEWIFSGERAGVTTAESHSGGSAILLSDSGFAGFIDFEGGNSNIAALKINVPANGGVLSFWVKRKNNNPGNPSGFNKQIAQIRPRFGPEPLSEIFNGDFNDDQWQYFNVDLTPWADTVVTLYFEVDKAYTTPVTNQWMFIDDIEILTNETPVSAFTADSTQTCAGSAVQFTDLSTFFPTSWIWSFPGGNPATSTEQNPSVTYNEPGIFAVSLTATNGLGAGTTKMKSEYVHIYTPSPPAQCRPETQERYQLTDCGIHNVTFNDINHTTGAAVDDNGYKDFSCTMTTRLAADTEYPISVSVGTVNDEWVKVYIDYNNDGDFNDEGELTFSSAQSKTFEHLGAIHTPGNPIQDTLLRMRVITDVAQVNACSNPFYGQAEDYGVVFKAGVLPGDINNSLSVDLADAILVLKNISGMAPGIDVNLAADVDGDEKIGMEEAVYILQWISGLRAD